MPAPNWKHPSDYPKKADDLTPQAWAWEFLRRNPDYRSDYNKVQTALAKVKAKRPPAPGNWLARPDDPAADPDKRVYDPPLEPNESLHAWRMRSLMNGRDPKDYALELWYARKWKMQELVFSFGFGGAADLTRPPGSESALQRRARGCALPRTPAADTRSHRCG
jgi:hypothetical protein